MACWVKVQIQMKNKETAFKAAQEAGLTVKDFTYENGTLTLNPSGYAKTDQGQLAMRYGLIEAESVARKSGYRTQRRAQEDGTIKLLVTG